MAIGALPPARVLELGACRDKPMDWWFPPEGHSNPWAVRVCREECPVQGECLAWALAQRSLYGIWGGFSERARDEMRREQRRRAG